MKLIFEIHENKNGDVEVSSLVPLGPFTARELMYCSVIRHLVEDGLPGEGKALETFGPGDERN